ncbi:hypothetical protein KKJ04_22135, partial [Xenorhabdus bovienii]|uniref:hypothetical protein n=1 Tax=Xenorhabdus bovienii TaxID=40576 RepID=UPI0023B2147B
DIPVSDHLSFLGVNAKSKTAYVHNQTTQTLYSLNGGKFQILNKLKGAKRIGSSLLLQGGRGNDNLTLPIIDGVDSLVLYGGANHDTYQLSKEMWGHYRTVIIDNNDQNRALDRLILPITNPESILVSRHDDDLMLTDSGNGTALVVRQVFGSQAKAHQHLHINLEEGSPVINVERLVESISKQGNTNSV